MAKRKVVPKPIFKSDQPVGEDSYETGDPNYEY